MNTDNRILDAIVPPSPFRSMPTEQLAALREGRNFAATLDEAGAIIATAKTPKSLEAAVVATPFAGLPWSILPVPAMAPS